jgi:cytochrome d ubiquinol oxidase subunit II
VISLNIVWFIVLSLMVAIYAVLDGFDLGIGSLLLLITKSEEEREEALNSIGPIWNGNEVWLLAGGGAMVAAFPRLYACSFSGFYLPLMVVLWLFVLRGIGYEFRHLEKSSMWKGVADVAFSVASVLIALIFGVAVGNVLRGVPLDSSGIFSGSFAFLLNPFALVAGLLTVAILAMHGAAYLTMRSSGELQVKASKATFAAWVASAVLFAAQFGISFIYRPDFLHNYLAYPWMWLLVLVAAGGLVAVPVMIKQNKPGAAFAGTCTFIFGTLSAGAAGLFPRMLPAMLGSSGSDLTCFNTAASHHALVTALIANIIGMSFVTVYMVTIYRTVHRRVVAATG